MSQPDWVISLLDRLDPDLREEWEERAAIMHIDAKMDRDYAELLALANLLWRHPDALIPKE